MTKKQIKKPISGSDIVPSDELKKHNVKKKCGNGDVKKHKKKLKKPVKTSKKPVKKTKKQVKSKSTDLRRPRSDCIGSSVDVAQAAKREIKPPLNVKLKKVELTFWDSVIGEFAKVNWTDHTLELAAMLARNMYSLEKCQRTISKEGESLWRSKVIPATDTAPAEVVKLSKYANPLKAFLVIYHTNVIALRRSLALHARGKDGEARDSGQRRQKERDIEKEFLDDENDLLARPE